MFQCYLKSVEIKNLLNKDFSIKFSLEMKIVCLIIILCISTIIAGDSQEVKPPTIECLVHYLQSQEMGDEYFSSVETLVQDQKFICDISMK